MIVIIEQQREQNGRRRARLVVVFARAAGTVRRIQLAAKLISVWGAAAAGQLRHSRMSPPRTLRYQPIQ
jgi:hypothetical protein